jgi:predicted transcriptional regulator
MSTTTIRLPDDLKARIAAAAERQGVSAHGYILNALAEKMEQEELRADFHAEAQRRYEDLLAGGKTVPWEEVRSYLRDRIAGKKVARPRGRKLQP